MPTLPEHAERIVRLMSGAIATDESRLDDDYLYSVIHDARAFVLRQDFIKYRRWSPSALQNFYPDYDTYIQDSLCYTRFLLPTPFIQGNAVSDGLVFCGASGEKIFSIRNFWRIKSRNELSDFLKNPTMTPATGRYVGVLTEGLTLTMVSKETIKYPLVSAVFDNPTLLPTYNLRKDNYPISADLSQLMENYILATTMNPAYSRPVDKLSNTQEQGMPQANSNWKFRH